MLEIDIKPPPDLAAKIEVLLAAASDVGPAISSQVRESAFAVTANAKDLVPVSTGAMRRSIQPYFFGDGTAALIGSYLPYAARQEFDMTLNHGVRAPQRRVRSTRAGLPGSVIKGTGQSNPNATWGFMRKGLDQERPSFLAALQRLVDRFAEGWEK